MRNVPSDTACTADCWVSRALATTWALMAEVYMVLACADLLYASISDCELLNSVTRLPDGAFAASASLRNLASSRNAA